MVAAVAPGGAKITERRRLAPAISGEPGSRDDAAEQNTRLQNIALTKIKKKIRSHGLPPGIRLRLGGIRGECGRQNGTSFGKMSAHLPEPMQGTTKTQVRRCGASLA